MNPASEPIDVCWDTPGEAVGEAAVELELPASAPYHAVGRLVVGGVAHRAGIQVEAIEDLQLAVEALLCRRPVTPSLTLELTESELELRVRLGPFAPAPDDRDRVSRMLSSLVDEAVMQDGTDGDWIVLNTMRRRAVARESP
ncbi:MAG: hypothetical protein E6G20_01355 [Actinobacteria bacterium]|nr:MAG: hypothetical protein E6G20_01355 [Actinomycetota bacterium]